MDVQQISYYANDAAFLLVIGSWLVFGWAFILRKKPTARRDTKREPASWIGLILQGVGYVPVWALQREPLLTPAIVDQHALSIAVSIVAGLLAVSSVWFAIAALRELGRQWSLAARLTEQHKLVMTGVYAIVRHPIYTAMLGMLIATGLVVSSGIGLLIGVTVFLTGTFIRTRFEERLLMDAFDGEFAEWKARVPGLIPFLKF